MNGTNVAVGIAIGDLRGKGRLRRGLHWLGVAELVVGVFLVVLILTLVSLQVYQRYMPGSGWVWSGEIARFSLVWLTLSLSGYLTANDEHITLEMIDHVVSSRVLGVIKRLAHVIVTLIALAMVYEAYNLISRRTGQVTPAARMPLTWVYVLPFLGFLLTALRSGLAIFTGGRDGRGSQDPHQPPDEVGPS